MVGEEPTHVDSHQHLHLSNPAVHEAAAKIAGELGVPLRDRADGIRHSGAFYGRTKDGEPYPEGIAAANLVRLVSELEEGVTELSCHPGADGVDDPLYDRERALEVEALCDPDVRRALDARGVRLTSFARLATVA